jgi:hypothetical protein
MTSTISLDNKVHPYNFYKTKMAKSPNFLAIALKLLSYRLPYVYDKMKIGMEYGGRLQWNSDKKTLMPHARPRKHVRHQNLNDFYLCFLIVDENEKCGVVFVRRDKLINGYRKNITMFCDIESTFVKSRSFEQLFTNYMFNYISSPKKPYSGFVHHIRHNSHLAILCAVFCMMFFSPEEVTHNVLLRMKNITKNENELIHSICGYVLHGVVTFVCNEKNIDECTLDERRIPAIAKMDLVKQLQFLTNSNFYGNNVTFQDEFYNYFKNLGRTGPLPNGISSLPQRIKKLIIEKGFKPIGEGKTMELIF